MRVLGMTLIDDWKTQYVSSASALDAWVATVNSVSWRAPPDVTKTFGSADFIGTKDGKSLFVFNIKGNTFRLIARINFQSGFAFPKDFMRHAAYDKKCPITKEMYE